MLYFTFEPSTGSAPAWYYNFTLRIINQTAETFNPWRLEFNTNDNMQAGDIWGEDVASASVSNGRVTVYGRGAIEPNSVTEVKGGVNISGRPASQITNVTLNGRPVTLLGGGSGTLRVTATGQFQVPVKFSVGNTEYTMTNSPMTVPLEAGFHKITAESQRDSQWRYRPTVSESSFALQPGQMRDIRIDFVREDLNAAGGIFPDYSGVNIGRGRKWPAQFFSPFVDATLWFTKGGYSGLYPFADEARYSGVKFVNLGFIVADSNGEPKWGGLPSLTLDGSSEDVAGMYEQIRRLRQQGGDAMVSFGGENGLNIFQTIKDTDDLAETYMRFCRALGLTAIDFDIEGGAKLDKPAWQRNNRALKIMQDVMGADFPDIWFTFPATPNGIVGEGTGNDCYAIMEDAVKIGLRVRGVNMMTMYFGSHYIPLGTVDMAAPCISAAEGLKEQLKKIYRNSGGVNLTDQQAYQMIGVCPMIGRSNIDGNPAQEVFRPEDARTLLNYAQRVGLGQLTFWALTRDRSGATFDLPNGTGMDTGEYTYTHIMNPYNANAGDGGGYVPPPPVIPPPPPPPPQPEIPNPPPPPPPPPQPEIPNPPPQAGGISYTVSGEGSNRLALVVRNNSGNALPNGWRLQLNYAGSAPTVEWPAGWAMGVGGGLSTTVNGTLNSGGTVTIPMGAGASTIITNVMANGVAANRQ